MVIERINTVINVIISIIFIGLNIISLGVYSVDPWFIVVEFLLIALNFISIYIGLKSYTQYKTKMSINNVLEANGILVKAHKKIVMYSLWFLVLASLAMNICRTHSIAQFLILAQCSLALLLTISCCIAHHRLLKQSITLAIHHGNQERLKVFLNTLDNNPEDTGDTDDTDNTSTAANEENGINKTSEEPFRGYDTLDVYFTDDDEDDMGDDEE